LRITQEVAEDFLCHIPGCFIGIAVHDKNYSSLSSIAYPMPGGRIAKTGSTIR
jgi:hypothetical protein